MDQQLAAATTGVLGTAADRVGHAAHDMHRAVSDLAFAGVGTAGRPVKVVHDATTAAVYGAVVGLGSALGTLGRGARRQGREHSTAVRLAAASDGILGTHRGGGELSLFPMATTGSRLAIFVHGLADTESAWTRAPEPESVSIPDALASLGLTVVLVRYPTGRSVEENGLALSDSLDRLTAEWPVPVDRIVLIGHSMGGMVAQRAWRHGVDTRTQWADITTDTFSLGSPFLGSPLEQLVHGASRVLGVTPTSRPLAGFLGSRSAGVRDLRGTSGISAEASTPTTRHHVVGATLSRSSSHPVGWAIGDGLVRPASAAGPDGPVDLLVTGCGHLRLTSHPEVRDFIAAAVTETTEGPAHSDRPLPR